MKDSNAAKNKASNTSATENPSKIKNEEKPHRLMKISEFLKAKKNTNIDIDLSSVTKKTYSTLIDGSSKNSNLEKKKEEEKNISNNEIQEKEGNKESKIPEFRRKRKYRLRTNEIKLPSDITLLQRLCEEKKVKNEKNEKKEKEVGQPIFKFEEDENTNNNISNNDNANNNSNNNSININNSNEKELDKKKRKINFRHSTILQIYDNRITEVLSKENKSKETEENPECKIITYADNISKNKEAKNATPYQNKYRNYTYYKNQNKNNELVENEMVKNNYYIKLKSLFIELSFVENMNPQFEEAMEDKSKSIINFNNNPNEIILEIFDGHGGDKVSTYLQSNFSKIYKKYLDETKKNIEKSLSLAFSKLDDDLREVQKIEDQGSTGTIIHIIRDKNDRLFVYNGNVGDSRATLISPRKIERLSKEHRASDKEEKKRVLSEGGLIFHGRVNGELMLTRSFGDFAFKQNAKTTIIRKTASTGEVGRFRKGVICVPYIAKVEIDQSVDNQFLFMASDGIWDVISEEEIQQLIKVNNDTKYLSSLIMEKALIKQAWDNLSIFVVKLT